MEDQNSIKSKLIRYVVENDYLTLSTISCFIHVEAKTLELFMFGQTESNHIENSVERFLKCEGKRLAEIKNALRTGTGNRIVLHQQRKKILQNIKS